MVTRPQAWRILVVDDDEGVRTLLARHLAMEGYDVDLAADGALATASMSSHPPDLVILDVMLPFEDGLRILTRLRMESDVAVILLTGRDSEADRVLGLKLGADDYVVKPFSPAEIAARVASVLRRVRPAETTRLDFERLSIDLLTREVVVKRQPIDLTAREFDLLVFLASSPRQVFSREQLLEQVWKSSSAWQSERTITEHIRRLRKLIEDDPEHPRSILTVRGVGYRFDP